MKRHESSPRNDDEKVREGKPCFHAVFNQNPINSHAFHSLELQLLTPFFWLQKNLLQDELKKKFRLWGGKEKPTFGEGRRGGIPALVGKSQNLMPKMSGGNGLKDKMAPFRRFAVLKGRVQL